MAKNFHPVGFVTVAIVYPSTELSAINTMLVNGEVTEDRESGTITFHQDWKGCDVVTFKATIVFKEAIYTDSADIHQHEDHTRWEVGGDGLKLFDIRFVNIVIGGEGAVEPKAEAKADVEGGLTSELSFEAGVPEMGKIQCKPVWKRNDLNLRFDLRYDGDCQFQINITLP